jgi:hypothetical protein
MLSVNETDDQGRKSISLVAVFLSHVGSERAAKFLRYMERVMPQFNYTFPYYVINSRKENGSHTLYPTEHFREIQINTTLDPLSRQLVANLLFAINASLELPRPPRWFFRGTDDTFLNLRELPGYLEELEERYDPMKEWVFLGNGISRGNYCYPQGGSGYLMSQWTIREIARQGHALMKILNQPDDMAWGIWQQSIGIYGNQTTSERMCGHDFWDLSMGRLSKCPAVAELPPNHCRRFIAQVRRLVVYHAWKLSPEPFEQTEQAAAHLFDADPDIYWHMDTWAGEMPQMCRKGS